MWRRQSSADPGKLRQLWDAANPDYIARGIIGFYENYRASIRRCWVRISLDLHCVLHGAVPQDKDFVIYVEVIGPWVAIVRRAVVGVIVSVIGVYFRGIHWLIHNRHFVLFLDAERKPDKRLSFWVF